MRWAVVYACGWVGRSRVVRGVAGEGKGISGMWCLKVKSTTEPLPPSLLPCVHCTAVEGAIYKPSNIICTSKLPILNNCDTAVLHWMQSLQVHICMSEAKKCMLSCVTATLMYRAPDSSGTTVFTEESLRNVVQVSSWAIIGFITALMSLVFELLPMSLSAELSSSQLCLPLRSSNLFGW